MCFIRQRFRYLLPVFLKHGSQFNFFILFDFFYSYEKNVQRATLIPSADWFRVIIQVKAHLTRSRPTNVNLWLFKCHEHDVPISLISFMKEKKIVSAPILNRLEVFAIQIRPGQHVRRRYNGGDTRASFNSTMHHRRVIEFAKLYKADVNLFFNTDRITTKLLSYRSKKWHVRKQNTVTKSIGFELKCPVRLRRWPVFGTRFYSCI